jgi:catechol 2,3-dioxygenase-like lactoylglutathione lyase family enzyme
MNVEWIASVAVIAADPAKSRELYVDALGLPLAPDSFGEYFHSERIGGSKPLSEHQRSTPINVVAPRNWRRCEAAVPNDPGGAQRSGRRGPSGPGMW